MYILIKTNALQRLKEPEEFHVIIIIIIENKVLKTISQNISLAKYDCYPYQLTYDI